MKRAANTKADVKPAQMMADDDKDEDDDEIIEETESEHGLLHFLNINRLTRFSRFI